jgi:hypothetical protein
MTAENGGAPQTLGLTEVASVDLHPEARVASATKDEGGRIVCPVCGGHNPPEAVFCGNPTCHKALGNFKYVLEELEAEARWHHVVADKVTALIAKPLEGAKGARYICRGTGAPCTATRSRPPLQCIPNDWLLYWQNIFVPCAINTPPATCLPSQPSPSRGERSSGGEIAAPGT